MNIEDLYEGLQFKTDRKDVIYTISSIDRENDKCLVSWNYPASGEPDTMTFSLFDTLNHFDLHEWHIVTNNQ